MLKGKLTSKSGFYIGDLEYVLPGADDYGARPDNGYIVAFTHHGNGIYHDTDEFEYPVDSGRIGIVDTEHITDLNGIDYMGRFERDATEVTFTAEDGLFTFEFDTGLVVTLDTGYCDDDIVFERETPIGTIRVRESASTGVIIYFWDAKTGEETQLCSAEYDLSSNRVQTNIY